MDTKMHLDTIILKKVKKHKRDIIILKKADKQGRGMNTAKEAGHWVCSTDVIYDLIHAGKLKVFHVGRSIRISANEVERYENQN